MKIDKNKKSSVQFLSEDFLLVKKDLFILVSYCVSKHIANHFRYGAS